MNRLSLERNKIYQGNLLLVNGSCPIMGRGERDLIPADIHFPEILMRHDAAVALQQILKEIDSADRIVPVSGYRSKAEQTAIYEETLKEKGEEFTGKYVALPGHSEHQSGLAIDLGLNQEEIDFICPDFPYEGICEDFRKAAPDYGFIERYAKEKEEITGISNEPWHFRYVGIPHASVMAFHNFCLEEYLDYLKDFPYEGRHLEVHVENKSFELFYKKAEDDLTELTLPGYLPFQVSGDNREGFVFTLWR